MGFSGRLDELAQALRRAGAVVGLLEAIGEVLKAYEGGNLEAEEALEEIRLLLEGLVEEGEGAGGVSQGLSA